MSENKTPLTAIILTHRLDHRLEQALASVQFAQEIVLAYDQNHGEKGLVEAKDKLVTLGKKYHFKTLMLEAGKLNTDNLAQLNFAQLRQQLLSAAHQPWVFYLDSDERLEPSSQSELQRLIQKENLAGIRVKRQDCFLGQPLKFGEVSRVKLLRLARKDQLLWQRPVHEVAKVEGRVIDSQIKLWHQAHLSLEGFITDVTKYARLEAIHRQQQGRHFQLGQLLFYPSGKFIYNYFLKLGFLDGWAGFVYASIMSLHSLAVRVFQFELDQS